MQPIRTRRCVAIIYIVDGMWVAFKITFKYEREDQRYTIMMLMTTRREKYIFENLISLTIWRCCGLDDESMATRLVCFRLGIFQFAFLLRSLISMWHIQPRRLMIMLSSFFASLFQWINIFFQVDDDDDAPSASLIFIFSVCNFLSFFQQ